MNRGTIQILSGLTAILGAALLFELVVSASFFGADDAFIHLRYIHNFQLFSVFGFNPGIPSNGSTSPFWVFFAALILNGAEDLQRSIKLLSTLLFLLSICLFFMFSKKLVRSSGPALLATLLFATDPWLLKWAGSMMETSLVCALILTTAILMLRPQTTQNSAVISFLLAIGTLVRPEIASLFLLSVCLSFFDSPRSDRYRRTIWSLIVFATALLPWLVFSQVMFHSIVPNTFSAKILGSQASSVDVGWYFLRVLVATYWPWGLLFLVLRLRYPASNRSDTTDASDNRRRVERLFLLWSILVILFYVMGKLQTPSTRYLQLILPVLLGIGFAFAYRRTDSREGGSGGHRRFLTSAILLIAAYNIAFNLLIVLPSSLDYTRGVLEPYEQIGRWLDDNTHPGSRAAVLTDVGVIGYYSNRSIIDLHGLNTPEVHPYLHDNLSYVFVSRPEFLVMTGEGKRFSLVEDKRFSQKAVPVLSLSTPVGSRATLVNLGRNTPAPDTLFVSLYALNW